MTAAPPLAFGPIYLAGAAIALGFLVILAMGRPPRAHERPAERGRRGRAPASEPLRELEGSVEKKAEFLVHMGFSEIDWIADEPEKGVTAFRVQNPMPMSGGNYLVHFLASTKWTKPVESARVHDFRATVKHEEGVMKGILVTAGAFTEEAFAAQEHAPIELIDGKQLDSLLRMFYPERFPKERM
jgi:hypothetical protein